MACTKLFSVYYCTFEPYVSMLRFLLAKDSRVEEYNRNVWITFLRTTLCLILLQETVY